MIHIRDLEVKDSSIIASWPSYPPEFKALDYALRENGWIAEYSVKPDTRCFVVEQDGEMIAFTLLSKTGADEAEFRIAVRADCIGSGLGSSIAALTFEKGFSAMGLSRIHLIVRKSNTRAAGLYRRLGFVERGEIQKTVNGKLTDFYTMDLDKQGDSAWTRWLE
ncbi:MAG: GNAT family N-acetyltransferase [Desulfobacteraceae bacterium]|jgi:RimJ/RimL family protein N-acetyltransferase